MFAGHSARRLGTGYRHHYHHANHGPHSHHRRNQPMSVCRDCGFATRHAAILERHRRHCPRAGHVTNGARAAAVAESTTAARKTTSGLPAPTVRRNYKCAKCSFVTNRAKLFLFHQNCIHGENINVYGCDHCDYASRHKNKVLRHKRLVHKTTSSSSSSSSSSTRSLLLVDAAASGSQRPPGDGIPANGDEKPSVGLNNVSANAGSGEWPVDLSASDGKLVEDGDDDEDRLVIVEGDEFYSNRPGRMQPEDGAVESERSSRETETEVAAHNDEEDDECSLPNADIDLTGSMSEVVRGGSMSPSLAGAGTLLRCRYCRYTNRHKWKMASHIRASHAAGRPVYRCPDCPKFSTDSRVMWSAHRSRHSGKTMFECPECAYATTMKRNYERHLERHRAGGPRRCSLCSYSSTGEGAIQRHMAEYHPPSPQPKAVATIDVATRSSEAVGLSEPLGSPSEAIDGDMADDDHVDPTAETRPPTFRNDGSAACVENETNRWTSGRLFDPISKALSKVESAADVALPSLIRFASFGQSTPAAPSPASETPSLSSVNLLSSARTSKLPIEAVMITGSGCRCTCPLCPLSYKRPADLNRHMKQKHEMTLKEYVVKRDSLPSNRSVPGSAAVATLPSAAPWSAHQFSSQSSNSAACTGQLSISPAHSATTASISCSGGVRSSLTAMKMSPCCTSPDNISSSSSISFAVDEAPLNLSVKDLDGPTAIKRSVGGDEAVNLSSSSAVGRKQLQLTSTPLLTSEQTEPLDLSVIGSDAQTAASAVASPNYSVADLIANQQHPAFDHLTPAHQHSFRPAPRTFAAAGAPESVAVRSRLEPLVRTAAGFPCSHCSYVSKRASDLRRHQLVHTATGKRYRCPHCPIERSYKLQFDLGRHLARAHGILSSAAAGCATSGSAHSKPSTSFPAEFRAATSGTCLEPGWTSLTYQTSGPGGKNHLACPYCQYVGKSLAELERHARLHSGEKPHRCSFCGFSTIWKSDMKIHLQKTHRSEIGIGELDALLERICRNTSGFASTGNGTAFKPEMVGLVDYNMNVETPDVRKSSSSGNDMAADRQQPEVAVDESKPQGRCPLCPFVCQTPSEMSSHLATHETKLSTSSATASAVTKSAATAGGKRFACTRCGRKFGCRSDARNHVVLEHSEIADPDRVIFGEIVSPRSAETGGCRLAVSAKQATDSNVKARSPPFGLHQAKSPSTMSGLSGIAVDETEMEMEKLAEQYANAVTEMLYGNDAATAALSNGNGPVGSAPINSGPPLLSPQRILVEKAAPNLSMPNGRYRPYKCSQCGKRSNWRWDLKKHIRASRHPHADVVVLSDREARESFHEIAGRLAHKRTALPGVGGGVDCRPGRGEEDGRSCSTCTQLSGSAEELANHMKEAHPRSPSSSENVDGVFSLSGAGGDEGLSKFASSMMEKALYTVDRQKLKRLCCSACPYRSNFRSDVGRHIRHKHPGSGARVQVMPTDEATATLADYLDTWARKKFVLSPVKSQNDTSTDNLMPNDAGQQDGIATTAGNSAASTMMTAGNFVGCSAAEFDMEEDETLPWKCAMCEFTDPGKQAVVEHWQKEHCGRANIGHLVAAHVDGGKPANAHDTENPSSLASGGDRATISPTENLSGVAQQTLVRNRCLQGAGENVAAGDFGGKSLQCDICPYRTNKFGLLTIHKTYHRPQSQNSHKCPHCPYYVCAPRLLHQHVRIHTNGAAGNGSTSSSSSSAAAAAADAGRQSSMTAAAAESDGEELTTSLTTPYKTVYPCASCPYVGYNRNDFIYHRQFHRPRPSAPYKCERCPYWVGQRRLLTQHNRVHTEAYRMRHAGSPGGRSGSTTTTAGSGIGHDVGRMSTANEAERPAVEIRGCSPGDAVIRGDGRTVVIVSAPAGLGGQRRAVQRTIWRCDRCPYATAKRSQLDTHRQLHGSRQRHTCDVCDYSVSGVHLLLQHARLHVDGSSEVRPDAVTDKDKPAAPGDGEQPKPTKNDAQFDQAVTSSPVNASSTSGLQSSLAAAKMTYRCDKCPYSNARRDLLLCHARFHTGAGPLLCPHCDYSVSKVHLLTQHVRVHRVADVGSTAAAGCSVETPETKPRRGSGADEASTTKTQFMRSLNLKTV